MSQKDLCTRCSKTQKQKGSKGNKDAIFGCLAAILSSISAHVGAKAKRIVITLEGVCFTLMHAAFWLA